MNLSATARQAVQQWCQENPIQLGVLFGSQATGQTHRHSDVDVAVWADGQPAVADYATYGRWLEELQLLFNNDVNLVLVSAHLDPVLGMEICRNGQLLFERTPGLWQHHRLQLWHAYNDSLPFLQAARQRLKTFIHEVERGS